MVESIEYVVKVDSGRGDGSKVKVTRSELVFGVFIPWWKIHHGLVDVSEYGPVNWQFFVNWHKERGLVAPEVVIPWWQARVGDWVMADDGRILQILGEGGFSKEKGMWGNGGIDARRPGYLQTVIGTFGLPKLGSKADRPLMDTDKAWHPDRYKLGRTVPGTYINPWQRGATRLKRDGALRMKLIRMVRMIMLGVEPFQAYLSFFPVLENPRHQRMQYADLIQSQDYLDAMDEAIKGVAASAGWSAETVLSEYRSLFDKTKETLDLSKTSDARMKTTLMRDILRDVSVITGMIGKGGNVAMPLSNSAGAISSGNAYIDESAQIAQLLDDRRPKGGPVEGDYEILPDANETLSKLNDHGKNAITQDRDSKGVQRESRPGADVSFNTEALGESLRRSFDP